MKMLAFPRLAVIALSVPMLLPLLSCSSDSDKLSREKAGSNRQASVATETVALNAAAPAVFQYQDVAPESAEQINARMPVSTEPLVPARGFRLAASPQDDHNLAAATDCLTAAVYYEAAGQGEAGESAVAQVVINRMRHPAFPKTICSVVFQGMERTSGCQFTFTCDGSLTRAPSPSGWLAARRIARQALAGHINKDVGLATHYHTRWVVPYWRSDLTKLAVVGAHIFYRWAGGWGMPGAYRGVYAANETVPAAWASLRSSVLISTAKPDTTDVAAAANNPGGGNGSEVGLMIPASGSLTTANQRVALAADEPRSGLLADEKQGRLIRN